MIFRQGCFFLATLVLLSIRRFVLVSMLMTGLVVALLSCSSVSTNWDPEDYTVKSGDTLYSIAWRYELDTEEFAAWNNISSAKLIKPGQRLHTRKPADFNANKKQHGQSRRNQTYTPKPTSSTRRTDAKRHVGTNKRYSNKKWVKAKKGDTLYSLSKQHGVSVKKLAQLNQLKKPYPIKPEQTIFLKPLNTKNYSSTGSVVKASSPKKRVIKKTAVNKSKNTSSQPQATRWSKTVSWQRPANGKVVKKFSRWRNDSKGIDIAGKKGNAIVAAASGKVVYSGNGLISYGNLIIIKHNKTFLSAYAYNRKLLVKEGDIVKVGQRIAEMGTVNKKNARLHFEIRKNGKPVDPLKYLPR